MSLSDNFVNLSELENSSKIFWNIDLKLSTIILVIIIISIICICIFAFSNNSNYETFQNDQFYSYKNINYSNYASIPLTSVDGEENNITFGQATRMITSDPNWKYQPIKSNIYNNKVTSKPTQLYFNIDIFANLYILGGNVYDDSKQTPISQNYTVYLINPQDSTYVDLGNLTKDNDGLYRLKYKIQVDSSINYTLYNIVQILYKAYDNNGNEINSKLLIEGDLNSK